tara:strand:- start:795 stop:1046 length:252 start_codon:yes stop_codon:yes gene_type:complete
LNLNDIERRINAIPKYIGFLEYLKVPDSTNEVALSILIGLIVVWCALNDLTADIRINGPNIISNMLRILNIVLLKSGNIVLEK